MIKLVRMLQGLKPSECFLHILHMKFKIFQMDVKCTFLNNELEEEVCVEQPPRFIDPMYPNHVYRFDKTLHGLKQSPRV